MAALVRRFGTKSFELIEDAFQEAGLRALEKWNGDPHSKQLEGWLLRVASNVIIDTIRRDRRIVPFSEYDLGIEQPRIELDDELRVIFYCCHPVLPGAAQVALTLRVAFGFTNAQIARAFLSDERTIAQRIVRAKRSLREEGIQVELPDHAEVPLRLRPILDVLYQLFTEGYSTTESEAGIDDALCNESLRLARLLTDDDRWTSPDAEALRALFCFHIGRSPARLVQTTGVSSSCSTSKIDCVGMRPLLLKASRFWSALREVRSSRASTSRLVSPPAMQRRRATPILTGQKLSRCTIRSATISPSPVVDVNRALAVAMCRGAVAGIDELDAIPERELLAHYPYALATYAELHASLGHIEEARVFPDRALEHHMPPAERALLRRKRDALGHSGAA